MNYKDFKEFSEILKISKKIKPRYNYSDKRIYIGDMSLKYNPVSKILFVYNQNKLISKIINVSAEDIAKLLDDKKINIYDMFEEYEDSVILSSISESFRKNYMEYKNKSSNYYNFLNEDEDDDYYEEDYDDDDDDDDYEEQEISQEDQDYDDKLESYRIKYHNESNLNWLVEKNPKINKIDNETSKYIIEVENIILGASIYIDYDVSKYVENEKDIFASIKIDISGYDYFENKITIYKNVISDNELIKIFNFDINDVVDLISENVDNLFYVIIGLYNNRCIKSTDVFKILHILNSKSYIDKSELANCKDKIKEYINGNQYE